jgi:hypothetical protein
MRTAADFWQSLGASFQTRPSAAGANPLSGGHLTDRATIFRKCKGGTAYALDDFMSPLSRLGSFRRNRRTGISKGLSFWAPVAVCGVISFVSLLGCLHSHSSWGLAAFFAFLPTCFFYVGSLMMQMHREILLLRERISDLEEKVEQNTDPAPRPPRFRTSF